MAATDGSVLSVLMAGPFTKAVGGMTDVAVSILDEVESAPRPGLQVRMVDSGGGRGPQGWPQFSPALLHVLQGSYDLLHLHVASRGSTLRKALLAAAARVRGKAYVIHLHAADFTEFLDQSPRPVRSMVRGFFRGAEAVVVLGETWKALVVDRLGTEPSRVVVVHNGVADVGVAERTGPGRTVLFLGWVIHRKGADTLIAAVEPLLADPELAHWRCLLVGPHPEADLVEAARATAARVDGRLELLGSRHGAEKVDLLRTADILALPSRAEGLPLVLLEGMSAGAAGVSTPVGAIEELITDGENGLLVPPGDVDALRSALGRLMRDADERAELARAGRGTYERGFTVTAMVNGLESVWRDVAARHAGARTAKQR